MMIRGLIVLILLSTSAMTSHLLGAEQENGAFIVDSNALDGEGFFKVTNDVFVKTFVLQESRPTVIVIPGSSGTRGRFAGHTSRWARILNKVGYNAVLVDFYSARGMAQGEGSGGIPWPPFDVRLRDVQQVIEYLKRQPWHQGSFGLIGFSKGGGLVIELSKHPTKDIRVGVAYYPCCNGCSLPSATPEFDVQMHLALSDDLALPEYCRVSPNDRYSVHEYENAAHSFDIPRDSPLLVQGGPRGSYALRYDPTAASLSRTRAIEFLKTRLQ